MTQQALYDRLTRIIGDETGPFMANDEVNMAMIRHWCEAIEDDNPLYTDKAYASKSEYGGLIMPPTMIQAYCVPVLWPKAALPGDMLFRTVQMCKNSGYGATLGIAISYEFLQPLYPGDTIRYFVSLVNVSAEKSTRIGKGYFLTFKFSYTTRGNEKVCDQLLTIYQYRRPTDAE